MAMTKKERAEFDALLQRARMHGAFHWTTPVERDVPPPASGGYSAGWDFNSYDNGRVWMGWSTTVSHGTGPIPLRDRYVSGSQGARRMFSTKAKALAAMRFEMEQKFATILARIDQQIQQPDEAA